MDACFARSATPRCCSRRIAFGETGRCRGLMACLRLRCMIARGDVACWRGTGWGLSRCFIPSAMARWPSLRSLGRFDWAEWPREG